MLTTHTVTGVLDPLSIVDALPHEHLFVDFAAPSDPRRGQVEWSDVRAACTGRLRSLRERGVDLLIDCTPLGLARNVELLRDVSQATGVRIVASTGVYKGLIPPELEAASAEELAIRFVHELVRGCDDTNIRAGVIKLATTESGATARETLVHRAGAMAATETGAAIVLHSPRAGVMLEVLAVLEAEGFDRGRLVWAHAQDSTLEENLEAASSGVTISLDAIGSSDDADMIRRIETLAGAGHVERVVVSTDTSMRVNPPEMAYERSIEHLLGSFLPLVEGRLGRDVRRRLTGSNVARLLTGTTR